MAGLPLDANVLSSPHQLSKRGARDAALKLCGPVSSQQASLYAQRSPTYTSVLRQPGRFAWTVGKPLVCGALGVVGLTALDPTQDYVTEHVLEKQEFGDAVEWMMAGKFPTGGTLTAGKAAFTGIFDDSGVRLALAHIP
jgi:hypothetical protein